VARRHQTCRTDCRATGKRVRVSCGTHWLGSLIGTTRAIASHIPVHGSWVGQDTGMYMVIVLSRDPQQANPAAGRVAYVTSSTS
jgi:hypothetical protein